MCFYKVNMKISRENKKGIIKTKGGNTKSLALIKFKSYKRTDLKS